LVADLHLSPDEYPLLVRFPPASRGRHAHVRLHGICWPQSAAIGAITGRVVNASTGAYLEGAEVSLGGRPAVLTDRDGAFILPASPPDPSD
jgi:hypothetical protein